MARTGIKRLRNSIQLETGEKERMKMKTKPGVKNHEQDEFFSEQPSLQFGSPIFQCQVLWASLQTHD